MSKKNRKEPLKEFHVPFRLTLQGQLYIKATDAEAAREIADQTGVEFGDDDFFTIAEHVDWCSTGPAKEIP